MKNQLIKFLFVAIIIFISVFLDQWTKNWAEDNLANPRFPEHFITATVDSQDAVSLETFVQNRYPKNAEAQNKMIMANAYRDGQRIFMPQTNVNPGENIELKYVGLTVIDGYYDYNYARNPGAAFSFLADQSPEFRTIFFNIVGILAILLILGFIGYSSWKKQKTLIIALAFVLGGAVGNIIDRARFSYVIDFISWHVGEHYWPTFNIADVFVTGGVIFLVLDLMIFHRNQDDSKKLADGTKDDKAEAKDGDKAEAKDGDKAEAMDGDKAEAMDGDKAEAKDGDKAEKSEEPAAA